MLRGPVYPAPLGGSTGSPKATVAAARRQEVAKEPLLHATDDEDESGGRALSARARAREASWEDSETAVDDDEDEYVIKRLKRERPLPPITWRNWYREMNVISSLAVTVVPILSIYGFCTTQVRWQTALFAVLYYFYTGLGITAGYHRLWSHQSYNASKPLQYFLALGGSGAVQGSIKWWARGHRAHHRYTDTDLDPYSAHKGFFYSHIGWLLFKPRRKPGVAEMSDLNRNKLVAWQHRNYVVLLLTMGFLVPTFIAGLGWNDFRGGFYFAAVTRLLFVHHSTFCVNSLAHWLGEAPFDDKHTPRDHLITALVTIGEGYHNFHHEFPQDFRNAIRWYQYDPTKWFISTAKLLGLASELKVFPDNEVRKGQYNMQLRALQSNFKDVKWPHDSNDLPILTWDEYQEQHKSSGRKLIVVGGFIHDVTTFISEHPGGQAIIRTRLGKDATAAFNGGMYNHSNAAHNLLAMYRVGVIQGGIEVIAQRKKFQEELASVTHNGSAAHARRDTLVAEPNDVTAKIVGDSPMPNVPLTSAL